MFRATLHEAPPGRIIYKVGAPERLVERCVEALGDDGSLYLFNCHSLQR